MECIEHALLDKSFDILCKQVAKISNFLGNIPKAERASLTNGWLK